MLRPCLLLAGKKNGLVGFGCAWSRMDVQPAVSMMLLWCEKPPNSHRCAGVTSPVALTCSMGPSAMPPWASRSRVPMSASVQEKPARPETKHFCRVLGSSGRMEDKWILITYFFKDRLIYLKAELERERHKLTEIFYLLILPLKRL